MVLLMHCFRPGALLAAVSAAFLFTTGCSSDDKAYPVRTYNMGERVDLGHIVYVVFETQWLMRIGEGADERIPQNRFFLVRMQATNSLGSDIIVPNFTIEDDNGKVYHELDNGEGVPQWIGFLRSVKPAESAQGNAVFDAPPRHYKMKILDENSDRAAYIDIPLSFGAETPEMPTPGSSAKQPSAPIRSPATTPLPPPPTKK